MKIYLDTETRSDVDISKGTRAYIEGDYFEVLLVPYAIDDGEVKVWTPCEGEPMPSDLQYALQQPDVKLVFSNSLFDRHVLNKNLTLGFEIQPEDIIDVMIQALEHGFPGSLDKLSTIFGLGEMGKDKRGKDCIKLFCVPQKKIDYVGFHNSSSMPDMWQVFKEYAIKDVVSMREIHKRLPTVNYPQLEHRLWCLDQRIQDRGIPIDVELAEAAVRESELERARLNSETKNLTNGDVEAATQRDKLLQHISETYDVKLPDLRTSTLERLDETIDVSAMPVEVKELISLRLQSSMNSASKYKKVIQQEVNGRMHNTLQFCGASRTGRDAGRGLQPQNLRRPVTWGKLEGKDLEDAIEEDIECIKNGSISVFRDNVMQTLGDCVRGLIKAPKGKKLCVADLSNIEGRALVWLSNEQWKLDYFRKFDSGEIKFDNYVMAYAKSMNINPEDVTKDGRQIGKVQELGLGYGGGVSAFLTFAAVYRLNLEDLAKAVWDTGDKWKLKDSYNKYDWAKKKGIHGGLNQQVFTACDYLKALWREAHPATVKFWADLEDGFRNAISHNKTQFSVGRISFYRSGQYLYIRLPSGRCLVYLQPAIDKDGNCSFMGVDQFTKTFKRIKTYSGKLSENVTSATARDILFYRMFDIEEQGYEIVLRVHDELITECPDTPDFTARALADMMATPHPWCQSIPLAAHGFETHRYRKD